MPTVVKKKWREEEEEILAQGKVRKESCASCFWARVGAKDSDPVPVAR